MEPKHQTSESSLLKKQNLTGLTSGNTGNTEIPAEKKSGREHRFKRGPPNSAAKSM